MKKRVVSVFVLGLFLFSSLSSNQLAVAAEKKATPKVLILYSLNKTKNMDQVRLLDSLVGQFTSKITLANVQSFVPKPGMAYTELIYLGLQQTPLSRSVSQFIDTFKGNVLFIGNNATQVQPRFSFVKTNGDQVISSVSDLRFGIQTTLPENRLIKSFKATPQSTILLTGTSSAGTKVPLMVSDNNSYYLGSESLFNPIGNLLTTTLYGFFAVTPPKKHRIYLRLEDIHPKADPVKLMQIAKYLKKEHIPYLAVVIPEYVNQKTHQTLHLSDSPKLVKTLQYMQANGASIVLHGYKHQYRGKETGEGFEYWDVLYDRPVIQGANAHVLLRGDFSTEAAYQAYLKKGQAFEKTYMENTFQQGIDELVDHRLYPLAFEAPHYAMSQLGYHLLSKYFSTYIGQVQLTDQTWKSVYAPPLESQPTFLNGMTLLPETLGYVIQGDPTSIEKIKQNAINYEGIPGSYLSCFYHPYLGVGKLKELVPFLKSLPNAQWVNLKDETNFVQTNTVKISSNHGKISVRKPFIASVDQRKRVMRKIYIWGIPIASITLILILGFFLKLSRK